MINRNISPSEWEALSAYLDHQLSAKERARLEIQLETRPEMRQGLQELQRTRAVIRSAPQPRAPRNFTLTPEMAGVRSRTSSSPGAFPVLRLASVLATIFFVIVFMGDLVSTRLQPAPLPAAQFAKEQTGPVRPVIGMGGGGGGGMEEAVEIAPAPEMSADAATEAPVVMEADPSSSAKEPVIVTPVGDSLPTATPWAAPFAEDSAAAQNGVAPVETEARPPISAGWSLLRLLEILLVLLAIGSAAAAYWVRRVSLR